MLCMGVKLLSIQNDNHNKQQIIITCATPICLFFIDFESNEIIKVIDFKKNKFTLIPQLIEFQQVGNDSVCEKFIFKTQLYFNL
jgi:hypothetical protein